MISLSTDLLEELRDGWTGFNSVAVLGQYRQDRPTAKAEYGEAMLDIIADGSASTRMSDHIANQTADVAMDPVTFALLKEMLNVSPVAVCAISKDLGTTAVLVNNATNRITALIDDDGVNNQVWISEDVSWTATGGVIASLPDVAAQAAVGRRLADVISHAVLDRFDLTVMSVDKTVGHWILKTDYDPSGIEIWKLMAGAEL